MYITKELYIHEDVSIQVTVRDYYQVTDVFLVLKMIIRDKEKELRFRIEEPYSRLVNHVLDCKEYGDEVRK